MTGTLTYKESHQLSGKAFAVVALVSGSARATESSIVTSKIYRGLSAKPVPFELTFDSSDIDPNAEYTIQATIVDGENAWATAHGVPVLTKGNPKSVDITLAYKPDLVKGTVSGQVTAIAMEPASDAYSVAILVDRSSGLTLGIDADDASQGLPVPFAIPYAIADITPKNDFVVTAEVVNDTEAWRNVEGVPVITNGNPRSGVQVVVAKFVAASPAPTASPTPAPSAPQVPVEDTGGGNLLGIIILITLIGAVIAFLVARGRGQPDEVPPADTTGGVPPGTPPSAPGGPAA